MENLTNFQKIISNLVIKEGSQELLSKKLNVTPPYVSMFETGKRGLSKPVAKILEEKYGYDANELLKIQSMEKVGMSIKKPENENGYNKIKPIVSEPKKDYRREVVPIENEDYMMVEYADLSVQAGILGTAPVSELPKNRTMLVPKEYDNGEYLVLKVDGNSMYKKDSDISIPDGTKILVKKFYLQPGEKLPIRNNLFVIDAKDGQALKQVILHDVEKGFIRCHSYNEDFKDYDVKMEDIYQIFIYRKVVSSRPPIPDIEIN